LLDLAGIRKASDLVFGKHERAVNPDVEHAVATLDQLRLDTELLFE
jgi:hypothetical protein